MASRQEEQQKKAIEFQILYSQLEQYQTQLANLQQQKQNLNNLSLSLEEVSKLKKGKQSGENVETGGEPSRESAGESGLSPENGA